MVLAVVDLYCGASQSQNAAKDNQPQPPCRSSEQDYAEKQSG